MATAPRRISTSESCHLRLEKALIDRIKAMALATNRTFNNACVTLLYDAIFTWEQEQIALESAEEDD